MSEATNQSPPLHTGICRLVPICHCLSATTVCRDQRRRSRGGGEGGECGGGGGAEGKREIGASKSGLNMLKSSGQLVRCPKEGGGGGEGGRWTDGDRVQRESTWKGSVIKVEHGTGGEEIEFP